MTTDTNHAHDAEAVERVAKAIYDLSPEWHTSVARTHIPFTGETRTAAIRAAALCAAVAQARQQQEGTG